MAFTSGDVLTAAALNTFDPSTKITNAAGSDSAPSYTFNGDENTGMFRSAADEIAFATGGTQRLTIKSDGDVGIGTTSPSQVLHVNSGTANTVALLESTDTGAYLGMKDDTSGSNLHVAVAAIGNDLALRAGNDNRVRIKDDGDVGIGTTTPSARLHVDSGAINLGLHVSSTDSNSLITMADDTTGGINYVGIKAIGDILYLRSNNVDNARLDTNGHLGLKGDILHFNSITSTDDKIEHTGTNINFATNGELAFRIQREAANQFTANIDQVTSNTADAEFMAFRFSDDTDTGLYRHGSNQLGLGAGSTPSVVATSTGVAINNSTSTGSGTNCDLVTASVGGVSMLALRKDTSVQAAKADIVDWSLSEVDFKKIQPRSFIWKGQYISPEGKFGTTNGDDVDDEIPEGSHLMRRAGFIYEEMLDVDLHLVGDKSIDWRSLQAATVAQVQNLLDRVAALESA